ncbi:MULTISPECIES: 50S ribosomal protein L11 methyltransferase [Segatella]|jgi:ribosomal protein L11 methyltransferase|nr:MULTISPECIES: 50S ribosomal protein L11 methyltransferase [Segatella]UKK78669.1 50S ribosomal protein L11 methyltransferase [Segatella baroniae B14]SEQ36082.1 ribosomal protein L11 methyltransferase [Segatella baroniae B14]
MKYQVATFQIECEDSLMETAQDLLADAAAEAGFESFEPTELGLKAYAQKNLLDKEKLDENIENFDLPGVKITYNIADVEDQNYNQVWEDQGFDPIIVDDDIIIYDAKHAETFHPEQSKDHIEIGIDAVQAFGTGTHQTTRMIVSALLHMGVHDKRILDCGCGTGILGLAASKLGAKDIVGYDIDEWSVENAKHNAEINGVKNMEIYHGDANVLNHISGIFDIVLANINRNILLNDMAKFKSVMAANGTLILSGFYEEDVPLLLDKAKELGLHEKSRSIDEKWTCLSLEA